MKIFSEFYVITISIILVGLPLLTFLKFSQPNVHTYNIVIYGDTIDATLLAYYLDEQIQKELQQYDKLINFNITLISSPQDNSQSKEDIASFNKKIYSFCGVEKEWMKLVDNTNLKYNIKEYGVYFGETIEAVDKNQFKIYSKKSFLDSFLEYGLSDYAAIQFFKQFAKEINKTQIQQKRSTRYRLEDMTISNIIKNYFPTSIEENSLKYFSDNLGLDNKYIDNFIYPVIWGSYLHSANSLSAFYKLLTMYCHKQPEIGKSLVIFEQPKKIRQKILSTLSQVKVNLIRDKILETYMIIRDQNQNKKYINAILTNRRVQQEEEERNDTIRTYIRSDTLFIFDNSDSVLNLKQFSFYKTIIDGKIKNDQKYEEVFTIYFKDKQQKRQEARQDKNDGKTSQKNANLNIIYSITRVCAFNCKGYDHSIYILASKHKIINSRYLEMFQSHSIKSFKKCFVQKSLMPTNKKLQQNENVYRIYDIDSLSDSYEIQLNLIKQISQSFVDKIKREYIQ